MRDNGQQHLDRYETAKLNEFRFTSMEQKNASCDYAGRKEESAMSFKDAQKECLRKASRGDMLSLVYFMESGSSCYVYDFYSKAPSGEIKKPESRRIYINLYRPRRKKLINECARTNKNRESITLNLLDCQPGILLHKMRKLFKCMH